MSGWQNARIICQFVEELFQTTGIGNKYRLRNQMEGSLGSIMYNIAEGFDRDGKREFINFLSFSKGSASELKSQTYRAFDKKLLQKNNSTSLLICVSLKKIK